MIEIGDTVEHNKHYDSNVTRRGVVTKIKDGVVWSFWKLGGGKQHNFETSTEFKNCTLIEKANPIITKLEPINFQKGDFVEVVEVLNKLAGARVGYRGIWGGKHIIELNGMQGCSLDWYRFKLVKTSWRVKKPRFSIGDIVEITKVMKKDAKGRVGDRGEVKDGHFICNLTQTNFRINPEYYELKLIEAGGIKVEHEDEKYYENDEKNKEEGMQIDERLLDLYEKGADAKLVMEEVGGNLDRELMDMLLVDKKKELFKLAEKKKADREERNS